MRSASRVVRGHKGRGRDAQAAGEAEPRVPGVFGLGFKELHPVNGDQAASDPRTEETGGELKKMKRLVFSTSNSIWALVCILQAANKKFYEFFSHAL